MPSKRALAILVFVSVAGLAACTSATSATSARPPADPSRPSAGAARSAPDAVRAVRADTNAPVTLAFAGDVHFTGRTAALLNDPATAFGPVSTILRSADLTALNLETAVTGRGTPQPKTYHFRARPTAFAALRDAGVDVVTMANNHVLDYGPTGLADTLAAARTAHFPVVGIGTSAAAAWAPYVTTVNGIKIAIIGVSQVAELASSWVATSTRPGEANAIDLGDTLSAVRAAKKHADVVVVFMHWGTEGTSCPDQNQLSLAPKLAAAGADVIIGAHAHMLQGSGWLGHTFVAYGMANFLWWEKSYSTATGVLLLTMRHRRPLTARFVPAVVSATGQPIPLTGTAASQALAHYATLRACAQLSPQPSAQPSAQP